MPTIDELLSKRYSTRAYLSKPVSEQAIRTILSTANKSASGGNMQPWNVYVLTGEAKDQLTKAVIAEVSAGKTQDEDGADSYPEKLKSPYRERRYECGMALYEALGIDREDKERRFAQWQENYHFFGAPVGILFTLDKQMGAPQYLDLGIYIQTLVLAAQEVDLNTCVQRSWASWPSTCANAVGLPEDEKVIVGLALGYSNPNASINQYRVGRITVDEACEFRGF